jgi:hypothetical protein
LRYTEAFGARVAAFNRKGAVTHANHHITWVCRGSTDHRPWKNGGVGIIAVIPQCRVAGSARTQVHHLRGVSKTIPVCIGKLDCCEILTGCTLEIDRAVTVIIQSVANLILYRVDAVATIIAIIPT